MDERLQEHLHAAAIKMKLLTGWSSQKIGHQGLNVISQAARQGRASSEGCRKRAARNVQRAQQARDGLPRLASSSRQRSLRADCTRGHRPEV
eukprot:CAMPEP_0115663434 /NCGR_PEP_ID=MMETSP0272-20121206/47837_1 /TAXON_ID=71861 /ORGANISM="Scrippsiella trochoidea, Strain CCMP3099" /LENGTH=91 /DNA_ID=CAMNT_0003101779 /DNA_START=55 /DNA_END=328 /DNA_ORIENTATION=+